MSNVRSITPNDPANFTPELGNYKTLQPFRYWCQKVLPLVYDDSLSYYELLCKVVDYLNKTMEDVETLNGDVTNLHMAYEKLQGYVNNYFSTLDVQEEINDKLDEMVKDGTLSTIISTIVKPPTIEVVDSTDTMVDKTKIYILNGNLYVWNGSSFTNIGSAVPNLVDYFDFMPVSVSTENVQTLIPDKLLSNITHNYMAIDLHAMTEEYISDAPITDKNVFLITFTPRSNFNTYVQLAFIPNESLFYYRMFWNKGDKVEWNSADTSDTFKFLKYSVTTTNAAEYIPDKLLSNATYNYMAIAPDVMNDTFVSDAPITDKTVFLITFTPRSNFNTYVQIGFVPNESTFYYRTFWNKGETAMWNKIAPDTYFQFLEESVTDVNANTYIPDKMLSNITHNYMVISPNIMNDAYITDRPLNDTAITLISFTPRSIFNTYTQIAMTIPNSDRVFVRTFWSKGDKANWYEITTTNSFYKYNNAGLSMFDSIACIGDSLSCGWTQLKDGTIKGNNYKYSVFEYFKKKYNTKVYWCGASGANTTQFINDDIPESFCEPYTKKGIGYMKRIGQQSLYIVSMGTNDYLQKFTVGTPDDIDNTSTFYGTYNKIVKEIHVYAPNAFILLVSAFASEASGGVSDAYRVTVPKYIASLYPDYCMFIDITKQLSLVKDMYFNTHYGEIGYFNIANIIDQIAGASIQNNRNWIYTVEANESVVDNGVDPYELKQ